MEVHIDLVLQPGANAEMFFDGLLSNMAHCDALGNAMGVLRDCYSLSCVFPFRDYQVFVLFFYRQGLHGCLYGAVTELLDDFEWKGDTDSDATVAWELKSPRPPSARMSDASDVTIAWDPTSPVSLNSQMSEYSESDGDGLA